LVGALGAEAARAMAPRLLLLEHLLLLLLLLEHLLLLLVSC
jgi:hypothetical protein